MLTNWELIPNFISKGSLWSRLKEVKPGDCTVWNGGTACGVV